jgi:prepilin-type N-terminal cleavage/methylation domain
MKSFTLIELLIVTTIILVFGGLSLSYYNNFTQQQTLKKEAQKLVNIFELAKKKASSGDLSGLTCNGGFNGYRVNLTNSSYSLWLRCGNTSVSPAVFSYSFPNNISITNGSGDYYFSELSLKIQIPSNPTTTITIKNSNISRCLTITISSSGVITLSDNFISC